MTLPLFVNEKAACAYLEQALGDHCRLVPEVHLRHQVSRELLRIDYAAVFRRFRRDSVTFTIVGLEVKRAFADFRDWTAALKQGIDYRFCTIEDRRATFFQGANLAFVFVFPDLRDLLDVAEHQTNRFEWAAGAERLAGKFNVGTVRTSRYGGLELVCSSDALWTTRYGPRGGDLFGTARRPGAG